MKRDFTTAAIIVGNSAKSLSECPKNSYGSDVSVNSVQLGRRGSVYPSINFLLLGNSCFIVWTSKACNYQKNNSTSSILVVLLCFFLHFFWFFFLPIAITYFHSFTQFPLIRDVLAASKECQPIGHGFAWFPFHTHKNNYQSLTNLVRWQSHEVVSGYQTILSNCGMFSW